MDPPKNKFINHINEKKLDNRKVNLEICTNVENLRAHYSKKGGVTFDKVNKKWLARITIKKGKQKNLGRFKTKAEAVIARDEAVKLYWKV